MDRSAINHLLPSAALYSAKNRNSESDTDGRRALNITSVQNLKLIADPGTMDRSFKSNVSATGNIHCSAIL